jgi:alkanesulfonate monooxygenase SsuD/methylene tetrahydromethanopterin reductase-like flavin-dependent oxidoreductase (luciferase family)
MAGINVFAADTRAEAEFIASSHRKWVAGVHTGNITLLPEPVEGYMQGIHPSLRASLERELAFTAIGTQEDVRSTLLEFIEFTGADELMIDARIFDPAARRKSYELAAQALANQLG